LKTCQAVQKGDSLRYRDMKEPTATLMVANSTEQIMNEITSLLPAYAIHRSAA